MAPYGGGEWGRGGSVGTKDCEPLVGLVGGGMTVGQRGDGVFVDGEEGREACDAQFGRAVEVVRRRPGRVGVFECGNHGVGVESGRFVR